MLGEAGYHGRPRDEVSLRHSIEQFDGVIEIAAFPVQADEVVGDEGGGGGAGGDQMGMEPFALVQVSGSGARLDELCQDRVRVRHGGDLQISWSGSTGEMVGMACMCSMICGSFINVHQNSSVVKLWWSLLYWIMYLDGD